MVTATLRDEPVGMAIGSFTSVSLEPALVGFFAAHSSTTWPKVRDANHFCINVLSEHQEDVCRIFAGPKTDRFESIRWDKMSSGSPILEGVAAWIDCDLESVIVTGDHDLVLGTVHAMGVNTEAHPLLFHRGRYVGLSK